jgi:hypothetical protein
MQHSTWQEGMVCGRLDSGMHLCTHPSLQALHVVCTVWEGLQLGNSWVTVWEGLQQLLYAHMRTPLPVRHAMSAHVVCTLQEGVRAMTRCSCSCLHPWPYWLVSRSQNRERWSSARHHIRACALSPSSCEQGLGWGSCLAKLTFLSTVFQYISGTSLGWGRF